MPGSEAAPAKVNLFLHVVGRRPDGYHLLDSLVVFASVGDWIEAREAAVWSLDIVGAHAAGLGAGPDNLVSRAAAALAARGDLGPFRLTLRKELPVASGLGGGSADAAATLRLLRRLGGLTSDISDVAASLGADVPVCLAGRPARMSGIGETLASAPRLPRFGLVLVNPGVAVSTAAMFAARDATFSAPATLPEAWDDAGAMAADLRRLQNDLEPPARTYAPPIGTVIEALASTPGCHLARMSGSGATCFGLFDDPDAAARAARALSRPGWWCWGGAPAA